MRGCEKVRRGGEMGVCGVECVGVGEMAGWFWGGECECVGRRECARWRWEKLFVRGRLGWV